jgi:hypothetical protein
MKFNEIERALLDNAFNKKPLKYFWINNKFKLIPLKIKDFANYLIKEFDFGKDKEDFGEWVNWIIKDKIEWDDAHYENTEKNFMVQLNITNYNQKEPDVSVFMIGNTKHKDKINEALQRLK